MKLEFDTEDQVVLLGLAKYMDINVCLLRSSSMLASLRNGMQKKKSYICPSPIWPGAAPPPLLG